MKREELATAYKAIGTRLQATDIEPYRTLGVDYSYVASLILTSKDIAYLTGELRNNLNRASYYYARDLRNRTLHAMASTLERTAREE